MQSSPDASLWDRWQRHARERPEHEAVLVLRAEEPAFRWRWGPLLARAEHYARVLAGHGVGADDTCALVFRHHPEFYPLYMGVVALGALPSVLAYPGERLHPDKFRAGLSGMARVSGLDWLLTETALREVLAPLVCTTASAVRAVLTPLDDAAAKQGFHRPEVRLDAPALLQHSSGTTGLQKAVTLSHGALVSHVASLGDALAVGPSDRIASWLPLYHDMGLIAALHLPLALGVPAVHLDPFEWVVAPSLLVEALHQERCTLCWLPNFAFAHMAKRIRDDELTGVSLEHVRAIVNCGEPLRADSMDAFVARLACTGLRPTQLAASYAMAETTFALTQTAIGHAPVRLEVDRAALEAGAVANARVGRPTRVCVSSGRPIAGCAIWATDAEGAGLGEGRVGELHVRSPALFDGYRNRPEETRAVLRDGVYATGDLGFCVDGEWFVVGRKKDIIIVAGRNLYPEDIEAVVQDVDGVLPGRVVAFALDDAELGTERVGLIVESALPVAMHRALTSRVERAVRALDVSAHAIHVVPPRWLIKSSSGKLSRAINRARVLAAQDAKEPR